MILATVYADIFDYPLTYNEMDKFQITNYKCHSEKRSDEVTAKAGSPAFGRDPAEAVARCGGTIPTVRLKSYGIPILHRDDISYKNGYYFLRGREKIINIRNEREEYSRDKWTKAKKAASLLKIIPTVKMVGVTGSLAMNNSREDDDIDFFIITARGTLWLTRFFTTILLQLKGVRRGPGGTNNKDKICLNMFMSEDNLTLTVSNRDIFTAHEVVQVRKIWDKSNTYVNFLSANFWVRDFLPNSLNFPLKEGKRLTKKIFSLLMPFEILLRTIQIWYMKKRRTTEVISPELIMFHPGNTRDRFSINLK
ncbi:MAG: hypothetical protein UU37_C0004G0007 [Candidatus Gottesmanbacteria bacterium GW2011_GWA2_41_12]|uniref:Polymerase nucleotidyl transferase domain-containing protein n=1 Tax=Candidatus Gottesmanbacteria bacterium GW2011_GWA2_41_12 TaxID=1618440 RepID=A0A0G0UHT2_9BACT|nr:MAG: hypothetical protein UU37_C0004G0007 [Candidatus Gottesmanbacteria bacterium GW2011_GWA2_41_12]